MTDMMQMYGVAAVALGTAAYFMLTRPTAYALHGYQIDYLGNATSRGWIDYLGGEGTQWH
jgi:hypothetical protein